MRDLFGVNIRKTPIEAEDGRYPDGTFAQMLCKNVAGQGEIVGYCSSGKWEIYNPDLKCPSRGKCTA